MEAKDYLNELAQSRILLMKNRDSGIADEGGILTLLVLPSNFLLSEMARIVEDCNAHIVNLDSFYVQGHDQLMITLQINLQDISSVIKAFERYEYSVVRFSMDEGSLNEVMKDRYESLMHYLEL